MTQPGITVSESSLDSDGVRLHRRNWTPSNPPVATLLLVHGLSDHSARYDAAARRLASAGLAVRAFDLRGHGRSGGARGHAPGFDALLQDLDRVRRVAMDEDSHGTPLFLLGHSMGGLIAIRYLEEYPDAFRGAIIVSPWLGTVVKTPAWKARLARVLNRVAPALPFRAGIPAALLSHDPAIEPAFLNDELAHDVITPRLWSEATAAMELAFVRVDRLRVPLLFLIAGDDRIVDPARSRTLAAAIAGGLADVRVLDGRYHEVLNETDAADTVDAIAAWVAERTAGGEVST